MDVRQLNSFVRIIELKSFTKAAEHLHVAQPALGLQIRKLEEELQVQLLVRHSRGIEPTEAGLVLLDHAREILARMAEARKALLQFTGPTRGRVMLGLSPSINFMISAALIRRCSTELPQVTLAIEEQLSGVLTEWVDKGRLDMCLAYRVPQEGSLHFEPLFREWLFFVAGPGVLEDEGDSITLAEMAQHPLIMPGLPHGLRHLVEDYAAQAGLTLNVSFEMQSVPIVRDLVKDRVGCTILPYGGIHRGLEDGTLVARKIVQPEVSRQIYLCRSGQRPVSAAEEGIGCLIREIVTDAFGHEPPVWFPPDAA